MKKPLIIPDFKDDLRAFPKQPLWMRQMEGPENSIKTDLLVKFVFIILTVLLCVIILSIS